MKEITVEEAIWTLVKCFEDVATEENKLKEANFETILQVLANRDKFVRSLAEDHAGATTGVHGAVSTATPNKLMIRDPSGRVKVAAPSAGDDAARKDTVDAHSNTTGAVHGASQTATSNSLARRDSGGRLEAAAGLSGNDLVNMGQLLASKATSGYQKLPGGLIIQWGKTAAAGDFAGLKSVAVAFPTTFPNAVFVVVPGSDRNSASARFHVSATDWTNSGFTMNFDESQSGNVQNPIGTWIAIGH